VISLAGIAPAGDDVLFMTGATGTLGSEALRRLLHLEPGLRALVLVRDPRAWQARTVGMGGLDAGRVRPVVGDIRQPDLGLSAQDRRAVIRSTTLVLHAAADTTFSRSEADATAVNLDGTAHLLQLAEACRELRRFGFVSTAFVTGRRTGRIPEGPIANVPGWVNPYEESKHRAEELVRAVRPDALVVRPSTVVWDRTRGVIPQRNAAHHALRLLRRGFVPLLPGRSDTPVDLITSDYVAEGIARLMLSEASRASTVHLCAGDGAVALGELLRLAWVSFRRDPAWRARGLPEPRLVDLPTYRSFERSVAVGGDFRLRKTVGALSHFILQLSFPKHFTTDHARAALGCPPPRVVDYLPSLLRHL